MAYRECIHDADSYSQCCDDLLTEAIRNHCPAFRFHKKESYYPCTIDYFAAHSELRLFLKTRKEADEYKLLKKVGEATLDAILEAQTEHPPDMLILVPTKDSYGGMKAQIADLPVYAHGKVIKGKDGCAEALEINYMLLFTYNGPIPIMGSVSLNLLQLGNHEGDWEHVTVRCDASGRLLGVWYNAHRNRDGMWVPASKVPRTDDGRIIAYVAQNSHGMYPTAGTQLRVMGVINDVTGEGGTEWRPKTVVNVTGVALTRDVGAPKCVPICESRGCSLDPLKDDDDNSRGAHVPGDIDVVEEGAEWLKFTGYFAGSRSPVEQKWFREAEPPLTRTTFEKVFEHRKPEVKAI